MSLLAADIKYLTIKRLDKIEGRAEILQNKMISVWLYSIPKSYCLTEEESAERSLLQQPVGWGPEDPGYAVGWTRSHMAW